MLEFRTRHCVAVSDLLPCGLDYAKAEVASGGQVSGTGQDSLGADAVFESKGGKHVAPALVYHAICDDDQLGDSSQMFLTMKCKNRRQVDPPLWATAS